MSPESDSIYSASLLGYVNDGDLDWLQRLIGVDVKETPDGPNPLRCEWAADHTEERRLEHEAVLCCRCSVCGGNLSPMVGDWLRCDHCSHQTRPRGTCRSCGRLMGQYASGKRCSRCRGKRKRKRMARLPCGHAGGTVGAGRAAP